MKSINFRSVYEALFLDKDGHFVVAQFPNVPILLWLSTVLLGKFVSDTATKSILGGIGSIALVVWALLEIYSGVNLFRKLSGGAVLAMIMVNRIF